MIICPSRVNTNYCLLQAKRRERFGHVSWKKHMQSCRVCEKMSMARKNEIFIRQGSYFHLNGGFSTSAMVDLSGGFPEVKYKKMMHRVYNIFMHK